jgi:hypothetical protein
MIVRIGKERVAMEWFQREQTIVLPTLMLQIQEARVLATAPNAKHS